MANGDSEFKTEVEAKNAAAKILAQQAAIPNDVARTLVEDCALTERIAYPPSDLPPGAQPALVSPFRWVIRNADLLSLSALLHLLKGTAELSVADHVNDPMTAAKLLIEGVRDLYISFQAIASKGTHLSVEEFVVFRTLKGLGAATAEQIAAAIEAKNKISLNASAITVILERHERRGDEGFTKRASDGRWQLDGV